MMSICPQPFNMEEQPAASSGKAIQMMQSKLVLPKTVVCVPKKDVQFWNNPDPTHNFLSTSSTKSMVNVETRFISTCMWAQHTKSPQVLAGAMFA